MFGDLFGSSPQIGPTGGRITFTTVIQDAYTNFALSGCPYLSVTTDTLINNSMRWDFGIQEFPTSDGTVIDVLFTLEATSHTYADGLYMTNQGVATHQDTHTHPMFATDLVQIVSSEPVVGIRKGIVGTPSDLDAKFLPGASAMGFQSFFQNATCRGVRLYLRRSNGRFL